MVDLRTISIALGKHSGSRLRKAAPILCLAASFHTFAFLWVRHFYALNLPHYDSIGSLTFAYRVIQVFRGHGYRGVLSFLSEQEGWMAMSFAQASFAGLFAPLLYTEPESIQLYNSLAVLAALAGMFVFARSVGASVLGSTLFAALFFLPDGLWWWDFGLLDHRRDAGMFSLMTCSIFLILALYLGSFSTRGRFALGIVTGAATGMALVTRDSAPIYLLGFVGVPLAALYFVQARAEGAAAAAKRLLCVAAGGLPFLLIWSTQIGATRYRLGDSLIAFGAGGETVQSFLSSLKTSAQLLFPRPRGYFSGPWGLIALGLAGLATVSFVICPGSIRRRSEFRLPVSQHAARLILISMAIWIFAWLHIVLSIYVGWRPGQPFLTHAPPLLPGLISIYMLFALMPLSMTLGSGLLKNLRVILLFGCILAFAQAAVAAKMYQTPPEVREANDAFANILDRNNGTPVVAELWFEILKVPLVSYRAAQAGKDPPGRLRFFYRGRSYDSVIAVPSDQREIKTIFEAIEQEVRCSADYIILTTKLENYWQQNSPLLIFRFGRPLIENLLNDFKNQIALTVSVPHNDQVVVLDNKSKATCGTNSR